jgi:hypothetical protein
MLLTIEGRSPLFLDKQETTMTTMTKLSALALAVAAFTTVLASGSIASAHGFRVDRPVVMRVTRATTTINNSGNGTGHMTFARVAALPHGPARAGTVIVNSGNGTGNTAFARVVALPHGPAAGSGGPRAKPNLSWEDLKEAWDEIVELANKDPGPACGWLVCSDGSK